MPSLYNRFVTCDRFWNAELHFTATRLNYRHLPHGSCAAPQNPLVASCSQETMRLHLLKDREHSKSPLRGNTFALPDLGSISVIVSRFSPLHLDSAVPQ